MDDETLIVDRTDYIPSDRFENADLMEACSPPDAEQLFAPEHVTETESDREASSPETPLVRMADEDECEPDEAAQVLEALLFSADTPLSGARLADLVGDCTPTRVRQCIDQLNEKYAAAGLSFRIECIARGYQMMTLPRFQPWLAKLNKHRAQTRLSPAALETVSIVAYKQPVIRADVEAIRGVGCGEVLNRLREMGLVKIIGRADVVGRPLLYGTTRKFLDVFGLADIEDLPPMESIVMRKPAAPAMDVADAPADESPLAASA
ncbi:MAG: SMC-Scp complex subunit ScpB [Planctomycetota bacterium]